MYDVHVHVYDFVICIVSSRGSVKFKHMYMYNHVVGVSQLSSLNRKRTSTKGGG